MKRNLAILELPFNLGLREPSPGKEPGVKNLPEHFKQHGFHELLKPEATRKLSAPPYQAVRDKESGVLNVREIADYANNQSHLLQSILSEKFFPIAIGGDCSILIGNALALKKLGRYGLFYLDGHTDYMHPGFSESGGAAGMDLGIVTGYGHESLTNIEELQPYFKQEHVWCVGNREYDQEYVNEIRQSAIQYVDLQRLREEGIAACAEAFLQMVHKEKLDGFWIHIDVDVLNDNIMPAVDSRAPDGLSYEEFNKILGLLLKDEKATGLEITILDPDLDPTGEYAKNFIGNFYKTLRESMDSVTDVIP